MLFLSKAHATVVIRKYLCNTSIKHLPAEFDVMEITSLPKNISVGNMLF